MKMDRIISGLVLFAAGVWAVVSWWWFFVDILKGLAAVGLVLAGLILVGLGLKDGFPALSGTGAAEESDE